MTVNSNSVPLSWYLPHRPSLTFLSPSLVNEGETPITSTASIIDLQMKDIYSQERR
jgi:hypothetical protein